MNITESTTLLNLSWLLKRPWRLVAFGFGSGLSQLAPGTVGTLWAWAFALILGALFPNWPPLDIAILLLIGFLLGIWACGKTGEELGVFDHSGMVWDEVIAFWIILFFVLPGGWLLQCSAFILFRFFDIVKPGPIGWVDAFFKEWKPEGFLGQWPKTFRGFGVMIDDLLAAFFTLLVMAIFKHWGFYS